MPTFELENPVMENPTSFFDIENSNLWVSGGTDRNIRIWDKRTGKRVRIFGKHRFEGAAGVIAIKNTDYFASIGAFDE